MISSLLQPDAEPPATLVHVLSRDLSRPTYLLTTVLCLLLMVSNMPMLGFLLVPVLGLAGAWLREPMRLAHAFSSSAPLSRTRYSFSSSASRLLQSRVPADDDGGEEESSEELFFDDFGGFVAGSAPTDQPFNSDQTPSLFSSSLTARIDQTRSEEIRRDARLAKNWKTGNWGVRGFILDKSDPVQEAVADATTGIGGSADGAIHLTEFSAPSLDGTVNRSKSYPKQEVAPIHVSAIVPDQSSLHDCHDGIAEFDTIAVGRTDGTVLIVKLGTEYMTKFTAVPKVQVDDSSAWSGDTDEEDAPNKGNEDSAKEGGPSVKVVSELVNAEELKGRLDIEEDAGANMKYQMEDPFDALYGDGAGTERNSSPREVLDPGVPFEVVHQFRAHEEVVKTLLFDGHALYTAGGDSGEIRSWTIPEDDGDTCNEDGANVVAKMIPGKILSDVHSDAITTLKTVSSTRDTDIPDLLLSASRDGSFALWDITSGDLVTRCQMLDDSAESSMIICADVDASGTDDDVIYFGTSSGHVVAYYVSDVIGRASAGGVCPIPSCRFLAHDQAVTSIFAVGEGTSTSGAMQQARPTSILLTGSADGSVKQW